VCLDGANSDQPEAMPLKSDDGVREWMLQVSAMPDYNDA